MAERAQTNSQYPTSYSTLIQDNMDLSATVWQLKTTSGFTRTGRNVAERRLTSNETVTVERRDICRKRLQKSDKRRPTTAYAEIESGNIPETA